MREMNNQNVKWDAKGMNINGMSPDTARAVMEREPKSLKRNRLVLGSIIGLATLTYMILYSLKWAQGSQLNSAY